MTQFLSFVYFRATNSRTQNCHRNEPVHCNKVRATVKCSPNPIVCNYYYLVIISF